MQHRNNYALTHLEHTLHNLCIASSGIGKLRMLRLRAASPSPNEAPDSPKSGVWIRRCDSWKNVLQVQLPTTLHQYIGFSFSCTCVFSAFYAIKYKADAPKCPRIKTNQEMKKSTKQHGRTAFTTLEPGSLWVGPQVAGVSKILIRIAELKCSCDWIWVFLHDHLRGLLVRCSYVVALTVIHTYV